MESYVYKSKFEDSISVIFNIGEDKVLRIGDEMNKINEDAYMNGYNWEAFFNYYLPKYAPDIMNGMKTDPESGTYVAFYDLTPENETRVEKFIQIIRSLVDNEAELYRIIREESKNIEWD